MIVRRDVLYILLCILLSHDIYSDVLFETIAQENLKALSSLTDEPSQIHSLSDLTQMFYDTLRAQHNPADHILFRTVYGALAAYEADRHHALACGVRLYPFAYDAHDELEASDVLDAASMIDLDILCGSKSPKTYLGGRIDRTQTAVGRALFLRMLAQPVADIGVIKQRQGLITEMLTNSTFFEDIATTFKPLSEAEKIFWSFDSDEFFKAFSSQHLIAVPGFKGISAYLNHYSTAVEINERLCEFKNIGLATVSAIGSLVLPVLAYKKFMDYSYKGRLHAVAEDLGISSRAGFHSLLSVGTWALQHISWNSWTQAINSAVGSVSYALFAYYSFEKVMADFVLLRCLQTKLISVAQLIRACKELDMLLRSNEQVSINFSGTKKIRHFLYELPIQVPELQELLDLLETDTFTKDASVLSLAGRIITAYMLMHKVKHYFIEPLIALGQLDAYASIARWYKEQEDSRAPLCLVHFAEQSEVPFLKAENFWNPFLSPACVVTNDLALGCNGNPRTILITGPNAGGKSTAMKAIVINSILAQTFGIAAAKSFTFTPFAKIMTYMNITDDIAAGSSHFKAGVMRAQQLMQVLQDLRGHQCALLSVDELFDGTGMTVGEAAAYSFIEYVGKHPSSLCVSATHFPLLTTLEPSCKTLFKNYRVVCEFDAQGRVVYSFLLEPGVWEQNIALSLLKQEGFSAEFLSRTTEIIQERLTHP